MVVAAVEPLLPARRRRFRYPGRKPLDDRRVLQRILFVLHTGTLGALATGSASAAMTAWQRAGVWEKLHELLLADPHAADQLEWDARSPTRAISRRKRGTTTAPTRSTGAVAAASTTCSWTAAGSRSPGRSAADRRDDIHERFLALACRLICWRKLELAHLTSEAEKVSE